MEPINTSVETSKIPSYDKHESIEQLHDSKLSSDGIEHVMSKNYDVDDILSLQKSPSNGLLDSYHEGITPENVQKDLFEQDKNFSEPGKPFFDDLINQPVPSINNSESHEFSSNAYGTPQNEPFCGTDKLNSLANYLENDDVEEFTPPSNMNQSNSSLLDFDPLNEPVHSTGHDESTTPKHDSHYGSHQLPDDIIEPVTEFKETLPFESSIGSPSAIKNDKEISEKFKGIVEDSPRTGTPDFLELDSEDLKPIDVKPESIKPLEEKPTDKKVEDSKPVDTKPADIKPLDSKPIEKVPEKAPEIKPKKDKVEYSIGPKEIFSKYGLDIWFKPERLNPTVEAFIYWRDPKLSAIVFVSGLVLLLSMAYYSLISVVANTGLTILVLAMGFRIYKHVLQAVQKTDQGHPYSVFLELDLKLPQEKVHELVDTVLIHINAYVSELRRLFLIENWMESVRFAIVLWVLTYVGSWFNGLTLVIIAFVSLFTLPKVYENNKVQIDQNLALVHAKLEELTNKIKDVLPALLRKKLPEKKE